MEGILDTPWSDFLSRAYGLAGGSDVDWAGSDLDDIGAAIHEAAERYELKAEAVADQLGHTVPPGENLRESIERAARAVVILDGDSHALYEGDRDQATAEAREWFHFTFDRELEIAGERYGVSADEVCEQLEQHDRATLREQIETAAEAASRRGEDG
jgi:hypothetical protein